MAKWNTVAATRAKAAEQKKRNFGAYLSESLRGHAEPEINQNVLKRLLNELAAQPMAYEGEKAVMSSDGRIFRVVCFETGKDEEIETTEPTLVIKYTGLLRVVAHAPTVIFSGGELDLDAFAPVAVSGGIGMMHVRVRENATIEAGRKGLDLVAAPYLDVVVYDGEANRRAKSLKLKAPFGSIGTVIVEKSGGAVSANFEQRHRAGLGNVTRH